VSEPDSLLLLVHRIPYPPNKGDKIRSYHLLRFLAERYRVHLGTFVDDPRDEVHVPKLREICADVCAVTLSPRRQRLVSLAAVVRGEPMSLPYYRSRELARWVRKKVYDEGVRRFVAFSSPMAQYAPANGIEIHPIVDFVDVDSEKWRQYGGRQAWPLSWIYRREGKRLLDFEKTVASQAAASLFVTREEADLFRRRAEGISANICSVVNGVDTRYFTPDASHPNPYGPGGPGGPVIVFTGMMDYWANVDAVSWFVRESFPLVRERVPAARFVIVGARPSRAVSRLADETGVHVTGAVPDVRPYISHAQIAVAPLRIARGIQNKVLEAMAMARPVVASPDAVEGLVLPPELRVHVSGDPRTMAMSVSSLLSSQRERERLGDLGRGWVRSQHDWSKTLAPISALIEGVKSAGAVS
jgi:sugar transferase (PEP-CTERM/EpsH1 system associated)